MPEQITQETENMAEAIGIKKETLVTFWREIGHEVIERNFGGLEGLVGGTKGWINPVS